MYHTGYSDAARLAARQRVHVVKDLAQRRLHKAFLRYHDANNWPMLREALRRMGREDLIGAGKHHLVPHWQPVGTGDAREGARRGPSRAGRPPRPGAILTQHTGLPPRETGDGPRPRTGKPRTTARAGAPAPRTGAPAPRRPRR
ncbi:MAG: DUF3362 domain-containing protein [Kofleriaceae bacterium]